MSTVVGRLHDAIASTPGPVGLARGIVLSLSDAQALDKLIAEMCEDEQACEACGTRLCETCAIGEHGCDHGWILCTDCAVAGCGDCARDAADDARAEAHAEAYGMRY